MRVDTKRRVYVRFFKKNNYYAVYTMDFSLFCFGESLRDNGNDTINLIREGLSIAVFETDKFEVF